LVEASRAHTSLPEVRLVAHDRTEPRVPVREPAHYTVHTPPGARSGTRFHARPPYAPAMISGSRSPALYGLAASTIQLGNELLQAESGDASILRAVRRV